MDDKGLIFSSGFKSLDGVLLGILKGDNVVWQTDNFDDYVSFAVPFARNAVAEGKKLVYFRFAEHPRVLPEDIPAECHELEPHLGFEHFIAKIFEVIEKCGIGACYVFDCLSDLAADWYSDRMLGNFFLLTCPYLYRLDTVAYFMLLKNHNTRVATDAIHNTAQVVIDVFRCDNRHYILPIKVENRYSPTLYMLHSRAESDTFSPVRKSTVISQILAGVPQKWGDLSIDRTDIWTNSFIQANQCQDRISRTGGAVAKEDEQLKQQLIKMIITRDEELMPLCEKYLDLSDLISIGKRMIGTGLVGGKSAGMLTARAIIRKIHPDWSGKLEAHDSFFVGSDVFYTYIIKNDCWWQRRKIIITENIKECTSEIREKLKNGKFTDDIIEQFKEMLNYFGQSPIIVRSSSLLEDAYGNAFSGKYESFFCANQGDPEQRLEAFLDAVKKVYASTMSHDALSYRYHRGLLKKDEQMALLIQRVSGEFYGNFYFPQIAGVAYSFNPFVWNNRIIPEEGVIRLVFGLGTRAVEQHGSDYTRIVAINEPLLRPEANFDEVRKHTQKIVDVLELTDNELESLQFEKIAPSAEGLPMEIFAQRDVESEERAKSMNMKNFFPWILTFENLLTKTDFLKDMSGILKTLESAYNYPVDVEFTANFESQDDFKINIVQCRPFQVFQKINNVQTPAEIKTEDIVIRSSGPIIGQSVLKNIDRLIYVVPEKYGVMPTSDRYSIARLLGELINIEEHRHHSVMLVGPGRWGTKMPELGIPVTFSEIRNASVLCELVMMHEGLTPDISLGTHFFNDLVEMEIVYIAVFPKNPGYILNTDPIFSARNRLVEILPSAAQFSDTIKIVNGKELRRKSALTIHVNAIEQKGTLFIN